VISEKESDHQRERIKISHLGKRGLRSKRASMSFISVLFTRLGDLLGNGYIEAGGRTKQNLSLRSSDFDQDLQLLSPYC
jgi:hypothetical protein